MIAFDFFGEGAAFHHLGIGVGSIKKVIPQSEPIMDPIQKVSVAFVRMNGMCIELIEPQGKDSPILRSIEKGMKLLHICYVVPDLEDAVISCRNHGFHRIGQTVPAVAFDNRLITWVYSNQYGLFELLQDSSEEEL